MNINIYIQYLMYRLLQLLIWILLIQMIITKCNILLNSLYIYIYIFSILIYSIKL